MTEEEDAYKAAIREIEIAKMRQATHLHLSGSEMRRLTSIPPQISYLRHLDTIDISQTDVTDIRPIGDLSQLKNLFAANTKLRDVSTVSRLTSLESLYVGETEVDDLSPLQHHPNLRHLNIARTRVRNLNPLTTLPNLELLNITGTRPNSISDLENCKTLRSFTAWGSGLKDVSVLGCLPALISVDLTLNQISEIPPLDDLTDLLELHLTNTQVSDLRPISNNLSLQYLYLAYCPVSDLRPLSSLKNLRRLDLDGTAVEDLSPLKNIDRLATNPYDRGLSFSHTPATKNSEDLKRISAIRASRGRAAGLFSHLNVSSQEIPSDSDFISSYILPDQGPIISLDSVLEGGDEDQLSLQEDLRRKLESLLEAIGFSNELSALKSAAEHYRRQIDKPLASIKTNLLYSAANTLRFAYEADLSAQEQSHLDVLSPKVSGTLRDVVETHALFFMGFPDAAAVHQRMLSGLTGLRRAAEVALAEPIVASLEGKPQVLDVEDQAALSDDLSAAKANGTSRSSEIGEHRLLARLGNIFGAVGRKIVAAARSSSKTVVETLIKHYAIKWVANYESIIGQFLKSTQGAAAGWFEKAMEFLRSCM